MISETVGGRIRAIRLRHGLKQVDFAHRLGIPQSTLSHIEQDKTRPGLEVLRALRAAFSVDLDSLLAAEAPQPDHLLPLREPTPAEAALTTAATPRGTGRFPLVDQRAYAGYLAGYADPAYLDTLPTLHYPGLEHGIAVQVAGNSMEPTIRPGDVLLCTPAERDVFKDNRIYVVVTREGALVKRVVDRTRAEGLLLLKSDNRDYSPETVPLADVLQVFEVRRRITADLSGPDAVYDRLNQLEQGLIGLERTLREHAAVIYPRLSS